MSARTPIRSDRSRADARIDARMRARSGRCRSSAGLLRAARRSRPSCCGPSLPGATLRLRQGALDVLPYPIQRDREYPLPLPKEVDHRLRRISLVHAPAVRDQGHGRDRPFHPAEMLHRGPYSLERDPGIQEVLDHPERDEVLERVEPLRTAPRCVADRRGDELGSSPVVQLSIRDADDPTDLGDPIPLLAHLARSEPQTGITTL